MSDPILIKRYASRRLYNTQTSEYVTLDELAELIRAGNDIEIKDRKTGEDLTRQYLLQIITEQESRGENVLPLNVLTGLVRSYSTSAQNFLPDFLSKSYEAFTEQQENMMRGMADSMGLGSAMDWQRKQAEIYSSVVQAWMPGLQRSESADQDGGDAEKPTDDVAEIKQQLAALQQKLKDL